MVLVRISPTNDAIESEISELFKRESELAITASNASVFHDILVGLDNIDSGVDVQILTDADTITELRSQFLTTTYLVEHIEEGTIELRGQTFSLPTFVISTDSIVTITGFPHAQQTTLRTSEQPFLDKTSQAFDANFEDATLVAFRKPGYSLMMATLEERFDGDIRSDFETALHVATDSDQQKLSLDPEIISLLVGAYHEILFYDLSRWGETTQLASQANFSRKKQELEEAELLDIRNEPIDVGRPRHRLLLGESINKNNDLEEIITSAIQEFTN